MPYKPHERCLTATLAIAAALTAACGNVASNAFTHVARDAGSNDHALDAPTQPDARACPSGQLLCAGACSDVRVDGQNCGGCGIACAAGEVCSAGACSATCGSGQAKCTGDGGAYCASFETDDANCGACGSTCPAGQVCSGGECATTCGAPLSECNEDGGAAYCADLGADDSNCGACGVACAAGQACSGGKCAATCGSGLSECTGEAGASYCANLQTDNANCGACGTTCPAGQVCSAGKCAATCAAPFVPCGAGCADVQNDPDNCGGCGNLCGLHGNSTPICSGGVCGYACDAGYHSCGAGCADDTSPQTCGNSCSPCIAPANATATCTAGACGFSCNSGYFLDNGACAPPPRPIAPLSTSRVTSRRPTLHWALPPGISDATVDLCLDRACTSPIGSPVHVTGTSYAPSSDLPEGVVYWRLHPSTITSVTSVTWQFVVGARTAPVDTSWGTTLDVNGDGYADVVVGAWGASNDTGRAYVYLGSPSGLSTTAATSLTGPYTNAEYGFSVASAGDVNGDGYADVAVGTDLGGRVDVYLGSGAGVSTTPATTLTGPGNYGNFGSSVASAGDVNGDGYADVVVGAPGVSNGTGRASVYLGSASGLSSTPSVVLTGPDGENGGFGGSVAGAGDVNGDGYADVVIGASGVSNSTGRAYLYLGGPSGLSTTPAAVLTGPDAYGDFGQSVSSAADVNGDGYADVVVGAPGVSSGTGGAYVFLGGASGLSTTPVASYTGPGGSGGIFGISVASTGDVNDDGYADLVVGAGWDSSAYVYLGEPSGLSPTPVATLTGPDAPDEGFGIAVASAGDVNGDGYSDLIVGADFANDIGRAYVYEGGTSALTAPATTLTGLDGVNGFFGSSVFGATN
jgi:FG-GAP repeat/FG-GAP-like repeat